MKKIYNKAFFVPVLALLAVAVPVYAASFSADFFDATSTTDVSSFLGGFSVGSVSSPNFFVDNDTGYVGLGTASPTSPFELHHVKTASGPLTAALIDYSDSGSIAAGDKNGLKVNFSHSGVHNVGDESYGLQGIDVNGSFSGSFASYEGNDLYVSGVRSHVDYTGTTGPKDNGVAVAYSAASSGDMGTNPDQGQTIHIGLNTLVSGTADSNFGVRIVGVSDATNNYGVFVQSPLDGSNNYAFYSSTPAKSYFAGDIGIGTSSPAAKLHINSDTFILEDPKTPESASDNCIQGMIAWDENYSYVCVATNTWKRSALATW